MLRALFHILNKYITLYRVHIYIVEFVGFLRRCVREPSNYKLNSIYNNCIVYICDAYLRAPIRMSQPANNIMRAYIYLAARSCCLAADAVYVWLVLSPYIYSFVSVATTKYIYTILHWVGNEMRIYPPVRKYIIVELLTLLYMNALKQNGISRNINVNMFTRKML